ncbi:LysM domain [Candidatus Nanopelagicaceae bacterium]
MSAITSVNQGFYVGSSNVRPSGIVLNRRGRLARTLVVLSLAIVLGSVVSANAGAGTDAGPSKADTFITVTVAPGETIWTLATRMASDRGDVRGLVSEILEVNSLASVDVAAGQKIRIPLS